MDYHKATSFLSMQRDLLKMIKPGNIICALSETGFSSLRKGIEGERNEYLICDNLMEESYEGNPVDAIDTLLYNQNVQGITLDSPRVLQILLKKGSFNHLEKTFKHEKLGRIYVVFLPDR